MLISHDTVAGRNLVPVDRWFIPLFIKVSTILSVVDQNKTKKNPDLITKITKCHGISISSKIQAALIVIQK